MDKYKDIIDISHFEPKHKRMSLYARSAQFAPFAALTGYEEAVEETGRMTSSKIEIEDGLKEIINNELIKIKNNIKNNPKIKITFFVQDEKKSGGKYITKKDNVKKLDTYHSVLMLNDGTKIKLNDILELENINE